MSKKAFLRRNLKVVEVSLCANPANDGARVALFKSEDDNVSDKNEVTKEQLEAATKAQKDAEDKVVLLTKEIETLKGEIETLKKGDEKEEINKADLPPAVAARLEKMEAENKASAEKLAKMEDEALSKSITDAVTKFELAVTKEVREKLIPALKSVTEDARSAVYEALAHAETLAKKGTELFKEYGRSNNGEHSGGSAHDEVAKRVDALRKADTTLTVEQARASVFKSDLDLRARYNEERK